MIKLENIGLASPEQMEFIIEGMRNPMNSWKKSDSHIDSDLYSLDNIEIGSNDLSLMQRLSNAGTEHRKYMRMMPVYDPKQDEDYFERDDGDLCSFEAGGKYGENS